MQACPKMQAVITQLAQKHAVDIGAVGARMQLEMAGFDGSVFGVVVGGEFGILEQFGNGIDGEWRDMASGGKLAEPGAHGVDDRLPFVGLEHAFVNVDLHACRQALDLRSRCGGKEILGGIAARGIEHLVGDGSGAGERGEEDKSAGKEIGGREVLSFPAAALMGGGLDIVDEMLDI